MDTIRFLDYLYSGFLKSKKSLTNCGLSQSKPLITKMGMPGQV